MASDSEFTEAVSYAVCKAGKAGIVLKPEQLQAVRHVFLWLSTGLVNLFALNSCHSCLTSSWGGILKVAV